MTRRGKFVGYCKGCGMMVASFDSGCPDCGGMEYDTERKNVPDRTYTGGGAIRGGSIILGTNRADRRADRESIEGKGR